MLNVAGEDNEIEVKILKGRISKPIECFSIDGKLTFVDQETNEVIASTSVPVKIKQAVLIFLPPTTEKEKQWKIFPFEDTKEEFPAGGTRVVNLHGSDIRFLIGQDQEALNPLQPKGFVMPDDRDEFNMASVKFQFKNNQDEWVTGKSGAYRFLPSSRYLLVAYIDPRTKRPVVKTFKDRIAPSS